MEICSHANEKTQKQTNKQTKKLKDFWGSHFYWSFPSSEVKGLICWLFVWLPAALQCWLVHQGALSASWMCCTLFCCRPRKNALFLVDLLLDSHGVHYSTSLPSFESTLISLFDKGILSTHNVPQLEKVTFASPYNNNNNHKIMYGAPSFESLECLSRPTDAHIHHIHTHRGLHVCMDMHRTGTYVCTHVCMHVHTRTHTHTNTCMHAQTHPPTHTHTHTHITSDGLVEKKKMTIFWKEKKWVFSLDLSEHDRERPCLYIYLLLASSPCVRPDIAESDVWSYLYPSFCYTLERVWCVIISVPIFLIHLGKSLMCSHICPIFSLYLGKALCMVIYMAIFSP